MDKRQSGGLKKFFMLLHHMSIKNKFYVILAIQMIILLVWYVYMININISDNIKNIAYKAQQVNHKIIWSLDSDISCMERISLFPITRASENEPNYIYSCLSSNDPETLNSYEYYMYVYNHVSELINMNYSIIDQVYIFDMQGGGIGRNSKQPFYINTEYNPKCSWVNNVISAYGKPILISYSELEGVQSIAKENHVYLARAIINAETYKPVGIILVSSDISDIADEFQGSDEFNKQNFGLYTFNGKLIFGNSVMDKSDVKNYWDKAISLGTNFDSDTRRCGSKGWLFNYGINKSSKIISIIKMPLVSKDIELKQYGFWGMIAVLFISSFSIVTIIIKSTINPIENLVSACRSISKGNFNITVPTDDAFEIKELSMAFNHMTKKINFLINEVYVHDIAERDLELQMLRNQINPHFIYNTLESMRMVAYINNANNLAEMCVLLAKTLRYGVTAPNEEVTVIDEINNLNDYIKLQKLLYNDHFDFTVNIEESLENKHIIKLIIQPIIENSIYHGLASITTKGRIFVLGYCENDTMVFKVIDNGNGMDESTLRLLNDYINDKNDQFKSIGLKNVHRRIRLYYGERFGLSIDSCVGKGTSVMVTLPL